jgi:hypothetical protein
MMRVGAHGWIIYFWAQKVLSKWLESSRRMLAIMSQRPYKPAGLRVLFAVFWLAACSTGAMTISWQDTSTNEQGFRIYRIANQQKTVIAEVGPNVTQFTDTNAPPEACYIVTAFNTAGESPPTHSVCRSK